MWSSSVLLREWPMEECSTLILARLMASDSEMLERVAAKMVPAMRFLSERWVMVSVRDWTKSNLF